MGLFSKKKAAKPVELYELIFCPAQDREEILSLLEQAFDLPSGEKENQITLSQRDKQIAFIVYTTQDEGEDGAYAKQQLQGVWNYFRQVETQHLEVQRNMLHHLRMCQGVIQVCASYEGPKSPEKEDAIRGAIWRGALALQGLLTQGTEVLCDAVGRPIFNHQGQSDLEYYLPPHQPLPEVWRQNEPGDCARRERTCALLEEKHIYAPAFLPLLGAEQEQDRPLRDVCGRAAALLVVALYSECRLGEKMDYEEAKAFVQPIIDAYGAEEFFSPKEREYLDDPNSEEQQQIQCVWQYENLWAVEWALGLHDDLFWPDHCCDVPRSVQIMQEYPDWESLLAAAQLRDRKEFQDQADLAYLLHWACVDARIHGFPAPYGLDEGVVMERHQVLFWLAGCDHSCGWDDVELST